MNNPTGRNKPPEDDAGDPGGSRERKDVKSCDTETKSIIYKYC